MKNIVRFISDLRTIIVACIAVIIALGYISGYLKLPGQVVVLAETIKAVAEQSDTKDTEHTTAIASLANSLDNYVQVQTSLHKEREKSEIERERKQDKQIDLITEVIINGNSSR